MYPPEPWDLRGQSYLSIFAVPRSAVPALPAPLAAVVRPAPVGPWALVGAAFVRYEPGGIMQYQELFSAVLVHERGRPRVSITDIWVDSPASRDGGRALWGIPKDLADLTIRTAPDGGTVAAASGGDSAASIGSASFRPRVRLPGRWPIRMTVAQALAGTVRRTPVRGHAAVRLGGSAWRVDARGPLGHLADRRPLLTLTLADFRLRFGTPAGAGSAQKAV